MRKATLPNGQIVTKYKRIERYKNNSIKFIHLKEPAYIELPKLTTKFTGNISKLDKVRVSGDLYFHENGILSYGYLTEPAIMSTEFGEIELSRGIIKCNRNKELIKKGSMNDKRDTIHPVIVNHSKYGELKFRLIRFYKNKLKCGELSETHEIETKVRKISIDYISLYKNYNIELCRLASSTNLPTKLGIIPFGAKALLYFDEDENIVSGTLACPIDITLNNGIKVEIQGFIQFEDNRLILDFNEY